MISSCIFRQQKSWVCWALELLWMKKNCGEISWVFREQVPKTINKAPKSINKDREIPVRKPWNIPPPPDCSGVRRFKHRVHTMDDITACTLDLYFTCGHIEYMEQCQWDCGIGVYFAWFFWKKSFFFWASYAYEIMNHDDTCYCKINRQVFKT